MSSSVLWFFQLAESGPGFWYMTVSGCPVCPDELGWPWMNLDSEVESSELLPVSWCYILAGDILPFRKSVLRIMWYIVLYHTVHTVLFVLPWIDSYQWSSVSTLQSWCKFNSAILVHIMFWLDQYSACLASQGPKYPHAVIFMYKLLC